MAGNRTTGPNLFQLDSTLKPTSLHHSAKTSCWRFPSAAFFIIDAKFWKHFPIENPKTSSPQIVGHVTVRLHGVESSCGLAGTVESLWWLKYPKIKFRVCWMLDVDGIKYI